MRIEQHFLVTDYFLWEVIKNGNKVLAKTVGISEQTYKPTTAEEKLDRRNEMKARGTLLMALPNKDQLKFHSYQVEKLLMEEIEKRCGGNKESKKAAKANYLVGTSGRGHSIYESELSRSSNTNQNPQNMAFVSSNSTSSTNEADTTSSGVSTAHTQGREYGRKTVPVETPTENALIAQDGIGGELHAPKRDLRLIDEQFESESVDVSTVSSNDVKTVKTVDVNTKGVFSTEEPRPGNPQQKEYKKGVIDSGCSRHMTGNKCYFTDFEAYDGGFVSFGDGKGRIFGKGKIKTRKFDFDDVYFCKELKYNLFSVSQMCDKKNNVLFTDTECLVLSFNFKFLDESQVLLRVPRKDNIYSVDLKSVVPTGGLTCLFAKATLDESNLWHRRLGHINFKTLNKLVKGNLFCEDKGIKREFNVARTPQQNGVAERRNRTLIEAARTMLVHSKLPTTFWAEAVNTACYVLNRALVTEPHNKTPYELILGRPSLIDFMKPFGCPITILNTMENLGKFEGKADEGYFVGSTGNQTNDIAGSKEKLVASQDEKKKELEQEYILIPICTTDLLISQGTKDNAVDARKKADEVNASEASDNGGQDNQVPRSEVESIFQQERQTEHNNSINGINNVSSPVSTAGPSFVNTALQIPINAAGPFVSTNAFEEYPFDIFSPFKNAFSLPHVPIVTPIDDTGIFSNAYDDDVLAEENKKDERGIVIKNKARLVAQGHTQEEGIDYDEGVYVCQPPGFEDPNFPDKVYKLEKALYGLHQAPRAWYETLSTYLLDNGFYRGQIDKTLFIKRHKDDILLVQVYVDDTIFGLTKKELSTEFEKLMHDKFQMRFMGELSFFLGLQVKQKSDGIFISQDRSMISSLMYLTESRPDITFAMCACVRFQVTPKNSHFYVVNRIFRYLKGQHKLVWYPKDSPFDSEAYSDNDYAGASLDKKSTTGGCQFLGKRLILWQCKKQTIVANSTTEAEYVDAANCCRQVLWIQN
nr:hypothetical protein [Tanacetum cinerariifolium]